MVSIVMVTMTIASSPSKHCCGVAKQPDGGCHEVMGDINLANQIRIFSAGD